MGIDWSWVYGIAAGSATTLLGALVNDLLARRRDTRARHRQKYEEQSARARAAYVRVSEIVSDLVRGTGPDPEVAFIDKYRESPTRFQDQTKIAEAFGVNFSTCLFEALCDYDRGMWGKLVQFIAMMSARLHELEKLAGLPPTKDLIPKESDLYRALEEERDKDLDRLIKQPLSQDATPQTK